MAVAEKVLALLLLVLGSAQCLVGTPLFFKGFSEPAFWFFNGGLSLLVLGGLNLVSLRADAGPGIRAFAVGANWVFACFWLAMAVALREKFVRHPASFTGVAVVCAIAALTSRPRRPR